MTGSYPQTPGIAAVVAAAAVAAAEIGPDSVYYLSQVRSVKAGLGIFGVQAVGTMRGVGVPACSAADAGGVAPQAAAEAWGVLPWGVFGHRIVVACYAEHHRLDEKTVVWGRGRVIAACVGGLVGVRLGGLVALATGDVVT